MKKIVIALFLIISPVRYCIGQHFSTDNTDTCNTSKSIDELYDILYGPNRDLYIQNHQHIAIDTLGMDSIKLVYHQNGAVCYEQWFLKGKCIIQREYYSNGQIFQQRIDKKRGVTEKTESFPVNYGKYCYLYGFKVYRRTHVSYHCDGTPWWICFLGFYHNKKVRIQIEFLSLSSQNRLIGAWIYKRKNIKVYQQFDWDEATMTWTRPAVDHVSKKK